MLIVGTKKKDISLKIEPVIEFIEEVNLEQSLE